MAGLYGQTGAAQGRINLQGFGNPGGLRAGEQRQGAEGNNLGFDERMSMIMAGADSVMEKTGNNTPLSPLGKHIAIAQGEIIKLSKDGC